MQRFGILIVCVFVLVGLTQCNTQELKMVAGELEQEMNDPYGGRLGPQYGLVEQPGPFSPAFGGEQENIFARDADPFEGY